MNSVETLIVATKALTLLAGAAIAHLSYRAYTETKNTALRALCIGFTAITVGAVLGGVIDLITPLDFLYGVLAQSTLTLLGFLAILYSLYR
ncbi:hypothetical protein U3A55_02255 [Salarchaeum sp. III]|uniref:DUF7521 family protein n=1 Tax=Salarchaeum sp. III TaxID=3107927 RepID=UPI002EDA4B19